MKLFVFISVLVASCISFGSGKFIIEPYHNLTKGQDGIKSGLSIYEKIGPMFWDSYTGMSHVNQDSQFAYKGVFLKNAIGAQVGRVELQMGIEFSKRSDCDSCGIPKDWEQTTYAKAGFKLW